MRCACAPAARDDVLLRGDRATTKRRLLRGVMRLAMKLGAAEGGVTDERRAMQRAMPGGHAYTVARTRPPPRRGVGRSAHAIASASRHLHFRAAPAQQCRRASPRLQRRIHRPLHQTIEAGPRTAGLTLIVVGQGRWAQVQWEPTRCRRRRPRLHVHQPPQHLPTRSTRRAELHVRDVPSRPRGAERAVQPAWLLLFRRPPDT